MKLLNRFLYYNILFHTLVLTSCSNTSEIPEHSTAPRDYCSDYTNKNTLITGKTYLEQSTQALKPDKHSGFYDSNHSTCIIRVTDFENEPPNGFARNDYSRRQPFNADDSRLLIYAKDGYWHLYNAVTNDHIKRLNLGGGSTEPQWHPSNRDLLYTLPNNGGLKIYEHNVISEKSKIVTDFTKVRSINSNINMNSIHDIWPDASRIWTKSEGSPSTDFRYWAFQVETSDFKPLGLISYDLMTNTILSTYDFKADGKGIGRPDHISMSPSGQNIIVSWHVPNECSSKFKLGTKHEPCGLMVFSRNFDNAYGITERGPHSDIAIGKNGQDVLVISNYITGYVEMYDLESRKMTRLFSLYVNNSATAMHISGKSYNKPGWILVSTYGTKRSKQWWSDKIFAVELDKNPKIFNISHTYNLTSSYWSEPHAVTNRDFTKIVFNSNWLSGHDDVDTYMIKLPKNAIH